MKIKIISKTRYADHLTLTDAEIPIVKSAKNITSSRGLFTGFLKRTIDNAPIIPKDNAKLFDITDVITYAITGSKR